MARYVMKDSSQTLYVLKRTQKNIEEICICASEITAYQKACDEISSIILLEWHYDHPGLKEVANKFFNLLDNKQYILAMSYFNNNEPDLEHNGNRFSITKEKVGN